jgi:hypothetical protein
MGADLELICERVGGWRGAVARVVALIDAVDRAVDNGKPAVTVTRFLEEAREAVVAGAVMFGETSGGILEDELPAGSRAALVAVVNRHWERTAREGVS